MKNSIKSQKSALRRDVARILRSISPDDRHDRSCEVCRRLVALEPFQHASTVMMYMPLPTEVDVTPLAIRCFQMGKTVCVPRVDWERRDMSAVEVTRFDDQAMDVDEHGIRTPRDGRMILPSLIDLVIIPGLAFDTAGNRLGRGGGFFDRFLSRLERTVPRIAAAFDEQIVDQVPVLDNDVRVDLIVTDRRVTRTGNPSPR